MIHSKENEPTEILEFCDAYNDLEYKVPLVVVPSTYNVITEDELIQAGINIVIYGNQLIRSAYPAMRALVITVYVPVLFFGQLVIHYS